MKSYQLTLKVLSLGILGIALIHITLGISSETLLGSGVSTRSLADPNLDSQNRFYGATFALFTVVFWLGSTDLVKYRLLLIGGFAVFFVGGLARIVSMIVVGQPSEAVILLTAIEIVGPPGMYLWLNHVLDQGTDDA